MTGVGASITIDDLAANPHPILATLRRTEPVSWVPVFNGWLVTRREECIAVMRDATTFSVDDPRFSTGQVIGPSMLSLDGLEHQRHRGPFVDPFRSAEVRARFSEWIRRRVDQMVSDIASKGSADLRASIAAPLSAEVMNYALDLQGVEIDDVLGWYQAIVAAVDGVTAGGDVPEAARAAFEALHSAVAANLAESALLGPVRAAGTLTEDEIVSNVAVLLFGGIVTSESTTASVFWYLLHDPEALGVLEADRSQIATVVEEAMRLEPAAAAVDRYATGPVDLAGVSIDQGDLVRVSIAAANRDPAEFEDPDRFDVHRPNAQQHLAFARGPHSCLGTHLARLEAAAAVGAVLDRLPGLRPDPERMQPIEGLIFRAPPTVHAEWDSLVGSR